ncbi:FecR domain-containing protein [Pseudoalteromonas spongiae]|uniref:FecR domain-containing protein n=1 Tax=Pseudoalteromonas spongiae TaxID=298657 RepID=UPI00026CAE8F|nr:FecR domain-containing protein [Pseudoalteromonas spongiae]ATD01390.1 transmembrane sensor [Pseudoalteromonas spongiae UST010723-006]
MKTKNQQALIEQVADWLVILQDGNVDQEVKQRFDAWLAQHPSHREAWSRAHCFLTNVDAMPKGISSNTVLTLNQKSRRRMVKLLTIAFALPGLSYLGYRKELHHYAYADHITQLGQTKRVTLDDGSIVELNTNTKLVNRYSNAERLIELLEGEVFIKTHSDNHTPTRPFKIITPHGELRALGTEFNVSVSNKQTNLSVFTHAVKVNTPYFNIVVNAAERLVFSSKSHSGVRVEAFTTAMWRKGLFVASSLPLRQVIDELRRYHISYIRVAPSVADIRVSGTFDIHNLISSLALLEQSLPISVSYRSKWWVTIDDKNST